MVQVERDLLGTHVRHRRLERLSLGLTGDETFDIAIDDNLQPRQDVIVTVTDGEGNSRQITMTCRIDTPVEVDYYRNGGILQTVLRNFLK